MKYIWLALSLSLSVPASAVVFKHGSGGSFFGIHGAYAGGSGVQLQPASPEPAPAPVPAARGWYLFLKASGHYVYAGHLPPEEIELRHENGNPVFQLTESARAKIEKKIDGFFTNIPYNYRAFMRDLSATLRPVGIDVGENFQREATSSYWGITQWVGGPLDFHLNDRQVQRLFNVAPLNGYCRRLLTGSPL